MIDNIMFDQESTRRESTNQLEIKEPVQSKRKRIMEELQLDSAVEQKL